MPQRTSLFPLRAWFFLALASLVCVSFFTSFFPMSIRQSLTKAGACCLGQNCCITQHSKTWWRKASFTWLTVLWENELVWVQLDSLTQLWSASRHLDSFASGHWWLVARPLGWLATMGLSMGLLGRISRERRTLQIILRPRSRTPGESFPLHSVSWDESQGQPRIRGGDADCRTLDLFFVVDSSSPLKARDTSPPQAGWCPWAWVPSVTVFGMSCGTCSFAS